MQQTADTAIKYSGKHRNYPELQYQYTTKLDCSKNTKIVYILGTLSH